MPNRFISELIVKKQQRVNGLDIRQTKHCQKKLLNADYDARVETQGSPSLSQFVTWSNQNVLEKRLSM